MQRIKNIVNKIRNQNAILLFLMLPILALAFQYGKVFIAPEYLNALEANPAIYLSSNSTAAGLSSGTLFAALSTIGFTLGTSGLVNATGTASTTSYTYTPINRLSASYSQPFGIAATSTYLYVGNNSDDTIMVYDISTPTNPVYVASFTAACSVGDIAVYGTSLYITNYTGANFRVYDLSASSTAPTFVRTVTTGTYPIGIDVSYDGYIYVANNGSNSISIFNAASSTNPILASTLAHSVCGGAINCNNPTGIAVSSSTLYTTSYNFNYLVVWSLAASSTSPVYSTNRAVTNPMALAVYGGVLLVSNWTGYFYYQFNIANPLTPVQSPTAIYSTGPSPAAMTFSPDGTVLYGINYGANNIGIYSTQRNYVAYDWKDDATSGVDIVTYTGTGANRTIAHSLNATPSMIIFKNTGATGAWSIYHTGFVTPTTNYLALNTIAGVVADGSFWNSTVPTPSVFSLGTNATVNTNGNSYVAYLFAEKPGFSRIHFYTGNSSTDGPYVHTGFKPKFVYLRSTTNARDHMIADGARYTFNPVSVDIAAGQTYDYETESGYKDCIDFLADGFKLRCATTNVNQNGERYIFAAFAEYPFERATTNQGFTIASSTRLNGVNSSFTRTYTTASTWTLSMWIKRSKLSTVQNLFNNFIYFNANDTLSVGTASTTVVFRDPSAWYHLVVNNSGIYVNNQFFGKASTTSQISPALGSTTLPFSGYLADVNFIDGQTVAPTSFGQADANGRWGPKSYAGTYGTTGFHLEFASSTAPGIDTSPNATNFTANNLAATSSLIDTPTNNFPTWNPISLGSTEDIGTTVAPLTEGNLNAGSGGQVSNVYMPTTGVWYWEVSASSTSVIAGLRNRAGTNYTVTVTNGTTVGFKYDPSVSTLSSTTNGTIYTNISTAVVGPVFAYTSGGTSKTVNFGQGGRLGLTYDAGTGGYFYYAPAAGPKALSSVNMINTSVSPISKPSSYFDAITYFGNGGFKVINTLDFLSGLIWIKDRSTTTDHVIYGDGTMNVVQLFLGQWFEF